VLRQYLQCREIVRPALWVMLAANVVNAFANWVLIFGNLGMPALGVVGAGLASTVTRILSFAFLLALVLRYRLYAGAWVAWRWDRLGWSGQWAILSVGLPIALQVSTEMWAFSASTLIVGSLFLFSAGLGVLRMPDTYNRIQTGTKATTLGTIMVLAGIAMLHPAWTMKLVILVFFVMLTNPVSSHALARAAHTIGIHSTSRTVVGSSVSHITSRSPSVK